MFYEPGKTQHGLPHDPFKACVVPRPIGWISSVSRDGVANLAPFSQFNNLTFDPPYIMFSANQTETEARKDTVHNVEATGVFCWSLATYELRNEMNITSEQFPSDVDEFEHAKLEKESAHIVSVSVAGKGDIKVPMVKRSPIKFECTYFTTLRLPGKPPMGSVDVVIGQVVGIHIDDEVLKDGHIDITKTMPIARCGYHYYAAIKDVFEMKPPVSNKAAFIGLEGSVEGNRQLDKENTKAANKE